MSITDSQKIEKRELSSRDWFSIDQIADYLSLSKNTIYQYVHRNQIPHHKIPHSRKLIFRKEEIDAWIIGTNPEPETNADSISEEIWKQVQ